MLSTDRPTPALRPSLASTLVVVVLAGLFLSLGSLHPASADGPISCWDETHHKVVIGCETNEDDGDNGEDGSSGGGPPPCDLSLVEGVGHPDATRYCEGRNACWANIPSEAYPTPDTWPSDPPSPDAIYTYKVCFGPDGGVVFDDWTWVEPQQPSVEELARQAYGELEPPSFELAFSPPTESVILVDTWWWAEGATADELVGTAALGVRAVAVADRLEVRPGDGSGTITCEVVVSESDACAHVYERASDGYAASARIVYDVHFEQNGTTLDLPGLPDSFESPWYDTTVPVTEVQANVVR